MQQATMTVNGSHDFDEVQQEHNERKEEKGRVYFSHNVDKSMMYLNEYGEDNLSVKEFYDRELQPYWTAYLEKKRADQKKGYLYKDKEKYPDNYYEYVMKQQKTYERKCDELKAAGMSDIDISKKTKAPESIVKEMIIQLGDRDSQFGTFNCTEENRKLAHKVFKEFIENWKKEYPEMKIIGWYIHGDEIGYDKKGGSIHCHIDYVPISKQNTKGMSVKNSLSGALREMSRRTGKDFETASEIVNGKRMRITGQEKWQQALREDFKEISLENDIEIIAPLVKKSKHTDSRDYAEQKDAAKLQAQKPQLQQEINAMKNTADYYSEKTAEALERYDELESVVSDVERTLEEESSRQIANMQSLADNIKKDMLKTIDNEIPADTKIPALDEIEWVKVKKEKKGMFDKQEYEELPRLTKQQMKLVEMSVGLTQMEFRGTVATKIDEIKTSFIHGMKKAQEGMKKVMYEIKGLIKLQKRNEELEKRIADMEKSRQFDIDKAVKEQVGSILQNNADLEKQNTELQKKYETESKEHGETILENRDLENRLENYQDRAVSLGYDNLTHLLNTVEQALSYDEEER